MLTDSDRVAAARLEAHLLVHARACLEISKRLEAQAEFAALAYLPLEPEIVDAIRAVRALGEKAHRLSLHYQRFSDRPHSEP